MEVITLGSRNTDEVGRVSPITVPVDSLPIPGILVLTNPLIIRDSGITTETGSLWVRNADFGYLRQGITSDKVVIGGSTFYGTERLNVVGSIHATGLTLGTNSSILVDGSNMVFTDGVISATLSELVNDSGNVLAADVSVVDADDYFSGDNVEDILAEIGSSIVNIHTHANKAILDDYTQVEADLANAVTLAHDELTLDAANGLSIVNQELSMALASAITTGTITSGDWQSFTDKLDTTDTLTAIKDLILSQGCLIEGVSDTDAQILPIGTEGQVLTVNVGATALEWADPTGTDAIGTFTVPSGFTEISNEIGDVNNTNYNPVSDLDGVTLLKVLQDMLFPAPSNPVFVNPTTVLTVTPSAPSPATMFNALYVENGGSATIAISSSLVSGNGPGGKPYAIADGSPSFTKNAVAFTTGTAVTFTTNQTFATSYPYRENGTGEVDPEFTTLSNGNVIYAENYTGANSGNATASKTYTVVDPIFYGNMTGSIGSYPTLPTDAELILASTKLVSIEPTSALTINVASYNSPSAVDNTQYIVVYYPKSYGALSDIQYVQNSNQSVIGTFTGPTTVSHTRPDTNTVDYYVYFTGNAYNNSEIVTYKIYF